MGKYEQFTYRVRRRTRREWIQDGGLILLAITGIIFTVLAFNRFPV